MVITNFKFESQLHTNKVLLGFWPTFVILAKVSSWKDESGVDGNYSGRKAVIKAKALVKLLVKK